jgi:anti-sigma-K factor RskA
MAMTTDPNDERDEMETLLPWYATGTLDAANRQRVEEALSLWPELRASLRLVEEDRNETIALNEELPAPSPEAWARTLAATKAEPRRPRVNSWLQSLARVVGLGAQPNPRRLAWIGSAAAIVILVQGATLLALRQSQSGASYQTATAKPKEGAEVLIVFAPDVRIAEISAFLQERHGSIDEGPGGGMYRVRFGDKRLSKEESDALIKDLSASPIVRLALRGSED